MLLAPLVSRMLRFFPPVVTGTIIAVIGISLMRVGIGWAMGGPPNLAQNVDVAKLVAMVDGAKANAAAAAASSAAAPGAAAPVLKLGPIPMLDSPGYMIPLVAPRWSQQMPHALHPLLESGILLTAVAAVAAVLLNLYFNGAKSGAADAVEAAKLAEAH